MSVKFEGAPDIVKQLQKLETGGEKAITRTVSDFASRAPAWVSKGIREHYGVDTAAIKDAAKKPKRGRSAPSFKVAGKIVDGAVLPYEGKPLTPIHFKMSPTTINPKGMTLNRNGHAIPKKYTVKATIFKGKRASFAPGTYLAPAGKNSETIIPFQREGDERKPVHSIHTVSVPQMVDNKETRARINELINENIQKRFEHHMKQVTK